MNKSNIVSSFFQMLNNEFRNSEGYNKFLILAIGANIPLPWIFIPYCTQAVTIVLVWLFLKQYLKVQNASLIDKNIPKIRYSIYGTAGLTILVQLIWVPFISQLITLVLLGLLYNLTQQQEAPVKAK